jgi:hypothetical protein
MSSLTIVTLSTLETRKLKSLSRVLVPEILVSPSLLSLPTPPKTIAFHRRESPTREHISRQLQARVSAFAQNHTTSDWW